MCFKLIGSWELVVGRKRKDPFLPSYQLLTTNRGFTFIEILMTLAVIGVLFVPVMQLFSNSLVSTSGNLETITAMNLAQSEIERTMRPAQVVVSPNGHHAQPQ